ncbi:Rieske 2Fe-2S domain-containing protein [Rhodococcus sp. NPDC003322]
MTEPDAEVRTIEASANPTRFARGWHCIGLVREYNDGKPHQVKAFGTSLVVFADSKGDIQVLDAYCRHMGGNLANGTVIGDRVACPFHAWEWDGSGKCRNIPYARRVPPLARTRKWHAMQLHGHVFVWNDPEGNSPIEEQMIPEATEYSSGRYSDWTWDRVVIQNSHSREIVDNVVDMAHFYYVHFAMPEYFMNVFDEHTATQFSIAPVRKDVSEGIMDAMGPKQISEATYFGPSYMLNWYRNLDGGTEEAEVESLLVTCHYPIDSNSFVLQWGVVVKRNEDMSREDADRAAKARADAIGAGFMQDVVIWKDKSKIDNPLLCSEDGPVYQLRRWYEQFYVDVADITEDMTNRFEFEIDTSRATEVWTEEVERNVENGIFLVDSQ